MFSMYFFDLICLISITFSLK